MNQCQLLIRISYTFLTFDLRLLISIQALYDYKSSRSDGLFPQNTFQFKHCTIISSRFTAFISSSHISIQALYDYKGERPDLYRRTP